MIEAYSAFSRLMRGEKLTSSGRRQAIARLETLRRAWIEVLPSERVLEIAITLPERHELRALDSLQLASALVWCREKPRARLFVCCDERLATTAAKVGFEVLP